MSDTVQANTLSASLKATATLLATDAEGAATAASEALDLYPGQPQALLLLVSALRLMDAEEVARELLTMMAEEYPRLAAIHYELGFLQGQLGDTDSAIASLLRAVSLEQNHAAAWRALARQLSKKGDRKGASHACAQHSRLSLEELMLVEDSMAGHTDDAKTDNMLRQAIDISPTDVFAIRSLGELELRVSHLRGAVAELKKALDLAPECPQSRYLFCMALTQNMEWEAANEQLQILIAKHPNDPHLESLLIGNLGMRGKTAEAMQLLEEFNPEEASNHIVWLNYALGARTLGMDTQIIVNAFRKSLELDPSFGTAWWGLADLKTYRFSPEDVETMRAQLERTDISDGPRCHLEFSLGTALESARDYAGSFEHFRKGNELRRPYIRYSADSLHNDVTQVKQYFTRAFFEAHRDAGSPAPDPIFIVGMPRAGSTLVEQILASHSQVEGTAELPDLGHMVADLMRKHPDKGFPRLLDDFDSSAFRKLGEEYLERTRSHRVLGRPFFTDKAGGNFAYVGLIQAILPNAKIIDARRHPLACGFSCYKQAFAPGALVFAYDQIEIARYYRDYVEVMEHFEKILPGRIHRVVHENVLEDSENEIRRMLEYCGLPFEEQCLRFYETERSVRTSSSEQVRQPIQKKKVETWQNYEPWLQPMKDVLGDIFTSYPNVPEFS